METGGGEGDKLGCGSLSLSHAGAHSEAQTYLGWLKSPSDALHLHWETWGATKKG